MSALFASGHAVDIVLLVILLEGTWLVWRGGWRAGHAFLRLAPGALMVLAVRFALTDMDWWWISGALLLSFPIHIMDIRRR